VDLFELQALERRINALLPPEYKDRYEDVRPRSMGTAKLKIDSEGKVAWGEIWTSFCDLALAGGPPHRGKLLEAVTTEEVLADPEAYQKVVDEIERGIRLVTNLPVVASRSPGWVGVRCESEEMAVWLMRAIIVENVMVRREGDILYLPAGPRFTVEREIKNVITTIAKTVHYWSAHLTARRAPS
jgi:sirohydrochlorin cobaltochelatase